MSRATRASRGAEPSTPAACASAAAAATRPASTNAATASRSPRCGVRAAAELPPTAAPHTKAAIAARLATTATLPDGTEQVIFAVATPCWAAASRRCRSRMPTVSPRPLRLPEAGSELRVKAVAVGLHRGGRPVSQAAYQASASAKSRVSAVSCSGPVSAAGLEAAVTARVPSSSAERPTPTAAASLRPPVPRRRPAPLSHQTCSSAEPPAPGAGQRSSHAALSFVTKATYEAFYRDAVEDVAASCRRAGRVLIPAFPASQPSRSQSDEDTSKTWPIRSCLVRRYRTLCGVSTTGRATLLATVRP